ncbi:MAG: protein kinase [Candidatus Eisenbacteria bacterium]
MPLAAGDKLGPYEVIAPLGAGGMGEVWRALDSRLGREVAIKVLPEAFAADPERLARFEREARLLASLQHPRIAGIYGLEVFEGQRCLVLEFVEGETLAARLSRGALPVDEAVEVCRQIAEGVEAAHEAGVVHRDLKPGNVMLKSDGAVKVLDFGLAKSSASSLGASDASLSMSPTMTAAATQSGVILGTAAYMSPEQARGRAVDRRADVWSFGCVLFECLTGRQAFTGDTVSDTIAAILRAEPDFAALPAATPARVRELLARCLCKDAHERLRDVGEARVALGAGAASQSLLVSSHAAPTRRGLPAWASFALTAVLVAAAALAGRFLARTPVPMRTLDLTVAGLQSDWASAPRLSPDGSTIAYLASGHIWVRRLDELEARSVAEVTDNASLCWSPDGRDIGFESRRKLWRVGVGGGTPVELCPLPGTGRSIGLAWSRRGSIAVSIWRGGIYAVPATGGALALLVDLEPGRIVDFHAPAWLPNGDLLYLVHWVAGQRGEKEPHDLEVFAGGKRIPVRGTSEKLGAGVFDPSGKLLMIREGPNGGLWIADYELSQRRLTREPRLLEPHVRGVSIADDGAMLYLVGDEQQQPSELVWVNRAGKVTGSTGAAYPGIRSVALSPDRRRVAFATRQDDVESVVWVRDLARGTETRITFGDVPAFYPSWLGVNRLLYAEPSSTTESVIDYRLMSVDADGSGHAKVVATPEGSSFQRAFVPPGSPLALRVLDETGHGRLRVSDVAADGTLGPPRTFARFSPEPDVRAFGYNGSGVDVSKDGRLVAYCNNDDASQLFVTRFPSGEGPWLVGTGSGNQPRWAPGSGALYSVATGEQGTEWLVETEVHADRSPPLGASTRLFELGATGLPTEGSAIYDVDADGSRFLVARPVPGSSAPSSRLVLVQNWKAWAAKRKSS